MNNQGCLFRRFIFIQGIFDPFTRNAVLTEYFTEEYGPALALVAIGVATNFGQWGRSDERAVRAAIAG